MVLGSESKSIAQEYLINGNTPNDLYLLRLETKETGEKRILGWHVSCDEDISGLRDREWDFVTECINGVITYQERGKEVVFAIAEDEEVTQAIPAIKASATPLKTNSISSPVSSSIMPTTSAASLTYPTAWNCINMDKVLQLNSYAYNFVIGVFISLFPVPISILTIAAQTVANYGLTFVYYKEYYYSRALSALEQERYYTYYWYSDTGRSKLITQGSTSPEVIYSTFAGAKMERNAAISQSHPVN